MKTPPLLLKLSLFFGRQGINPGSVKVHLILLFDTGPRVLFAQYILPLLWLRGGRFLKSFSKACFYFRPQLVLSLCGLKPSAQGSGVWICLFQDSAMQSVNESFLKQHDSFRFVCSPASLLRLQGAVWLISVRVEFWQLGQPRESSTGSRHKSKWSRLRLSFHNSEIGAEVREGKNLD